MKVSQLSRYNLLIWGRSCSTTHSFTPKPAIRPAATSIDLRCPNTANSSSTRRTGRSVLTFVRSNATSAKFMMTRSQRACVPMRVAGRHKKSVAAPDFNADNRNGLDCKTRSIAALSRNSSCVSAVENTLAISRSAIWLKFSPTPATASSNTPVQVCRSLKSAARLLISAAADSRCTAGCVPFKSRHTAVSYTHLDVYKRQASAMASFSSRRLMNTAGSPWSRIRWKLRATRCQLIPPQLQRRAAVSNILTFSHHTRAGRCGEASS